VVQQFTDVVNDFMFENKDKDKDLRSEDSDLWSEDKYKDKDLKSKDKDKNL